MLKQCGLAIFLLFSSAVYAGNNTFISLCYHNVADSWDDNPMTITTNSLVEQLSWLKAQGYNLVSLQQIVDARNGGSQLPEKAVLLTFDDGYANFYHRIYPILKMFQAPAVFALVTSWLETPKDQAVRHFGDHKKPRDYFVTWSQVREMVKSGLIEMASHTNNLHHGIVGNPQHNNEPAAITRHYDLKTKSYESDRAFYARISKDLKRSSDVLYKRLGVRPRALVWPYGAYNEEVIKIAKRYHMPITMTLRDGENQLSDLPQIRRYLIEDNPPLRDFAYGITHINESDPIRVARIELDQIYDPDPSKINENLSRLLDRIQNMQINTVYLQAVTDTDADGMADQAYFPNRHLPVLADLFNRVAWQLDTRTNVNVYAWMPLYAFEMPTLKQQGSGGHYQSTQQLIGEIYSDLAKYTHFDGLFFEHDHQSQPDGINKNHRQMNNSLDSSMPIADNQDVLTSFTSFLIKQVQYYQTDIKTAFSLNINRLSNSNQHTGDSNGLSNALQHYDYAVISSPHANNNPAMLDTLIDNLSVLPKALKRTVIELPTIDLKSGHVVSDQQLTDQMNVLQQRGALNFGYFPDNSNSDKPTLSTLKSTISLQTFPYGP